VWLKNNLLCGAKVLGISRKIKSHDDLFSPPLPLGSKDREAMLILTIFYTASLLLSQVRAQPQSPKDGQHEVRKALPEVTQTGVIVVTLMLQEAYNNDPYNAQPAGFEASIKSSLLINEADCSKPG
jgi:hypothetical protein